MKTVVLLALAFAVACIVAGVIIMSRPAPLDIAAQTATAPRGAAPALTADASEMAAPSPTSPVVPNTPPTEPAQAAAKVPSGAAAVSPGARPAQQPLQDPLAREALAFVGADPIAEEYWFTAINDLSLPANERQNLIEDLNEDGLSDPKHPSPEDLPLILSRLVLIEKVAPTAPDQVNADALAEAYGDLQQLARMAMGSGEAVK
jgi:hypothetical protein